MKEWESDWELAAFFGVSLAEFGAASSAAEDSIPRIVHQIWLGSPMPKRLRAFRESWIRHHPEWEFRLWTDADVAALQCRDLVERTSCYGQKSDVMRAEIVHRHGGFYVDLDCRCLRAIDELAQGHGFVGAARWILPAHLAWPSVFPRPLVVCNSFFGARAGHPVLQRYLDQVRRGWADRARLDLRTGELDAISLFALGGRARAAHVKETGLRTYLPFDEALRGQAGVHVLAPSYIHPHLQGWPQVYTMPQFWRAWRRSGARFPRLWRHSGRRPETLAAHLSHSSWLG